MFLQCKFRSCWGGLFWTIPLIFENKALIMSINRLNCFKRIGEKLRNFSLWGVSFEYCEWNVCQSSLISKNLPCPEKVLIARLEIPSNGKYEVQRTCEFQNVLLCLILGFLFSPFWFFLILVATMFMGIRLKLYFDTKICSATPDICRNR